MLGNEAYAENPKDIRPAYGAEIGISIMGAIVSKKALKSVVLIKEKSTSKIKALKVNDKILELYSILGIEKNYIVVAKGQEKIQVYKDKFAKAVISKFQDPKPNMKTRVFTEDGFERGYENNNSIKVKMTESYRNKLIKNDLQKILMQATALPFYKHGEIIGFQISQIEKNSIFEKGGFKNNDIIKSVNGVDLNSIPEAIKLLQSLKGTSSITLKIDRNNVERTMSISVN